MSGAGESQPIVSDAGRPGSRPTPAGRHWRLAPRKRRGHPELRSTEAENGVLAGLTPLEQNKNIGFIRSIWNSIMPAVQIPSAPEDEAACLEAAVNQAIEACDGDLRATIRALILANEFLETQISAGYARGLHIHSGVAARKPSSP